MLYLPNRKVRSHLYLPRLATMPRGVPRILSFAAPAFPEFNPVADLGSARGSFHFTEPFALFAITGNQIMSDGSTPGGFQVQWIHGHGTVQAQAHTKPIRASNCLGSGQFPLYIKSVDLFDTNDVLTVEAFSLANTKGAATSRIEICFFGILVGA